MAPKQIRKNKKGDDSEKKRITKAIRKDEQKQQKVSQFEDGEEPADEIVEEGDEKSENVDKEFKENRDVTIYITLPSGDEEIVLNYNMTFADKQSYQKYKEAMQNESDEEEQKKQLQGINNIEPEYKLYKVIDHLKKQGYPLENSFVSYYSNDFRVQINCGPEPISKAVVIQPTDLITDDQNENILRIVFARGIKGDFYDAEINKMDGMIEEMTPQEQALQRNKERSIGFVIEKVTQWRKLYNGYYDENQELKRMSLEEAACKVGVSKKSLDDYLSQIRLGRYNGFDFNKNKDEKVGELRKFNKEIKLQQEAQQHLKSKAQ